MNHNLQGIAVGVLYCFMNKQVHVTVEKKLIQLLMYITFKRIELESQVLKVFQFATKPDQARFSCLIRLEVINDK